MTQHLDLWVSPHDALATPAQVASMAAQCHMPGMTTRVLIPTLYGTWPQEVLQRSIGSALAIDSISDALKVRQKIEAAGVECGGWSVPRGDGDVDAEGYAHGAVAAQFDYFVINFESWTARNGDAREQFWTRPADPAAVRAFLGGFWRAVGEAGRTEALNGQVFVTWVTNSMLTNVTDDTEREWIGGTNGDALEAYVPGDRNLDPGRSLAIWHDHLSDLGLQGTERPAVVILEQGDLPTLAAQYAHPDLGVQVWTLTVAARFAWPETVPQDTEPSEETSEESMNPVPEKYTANGWNTWRDVAINLQGIADLMGQQATQARAEAATAQEALAREQANNAAAEQAQRDLLDAQARAEQAAEDLAAANLQVQELEASIHTAGVALGLVK